MSGGKLLLDSGRLQLVLERLCYSIIERYEGESSLCLVGIQPRGIFVSDRIYERLRHLLPDMELHYGKLDITFHRDDFRRGPEPLTPSVTHFDFIVEDKPVVLIDDVLYTGRTIHAAMTALQQFGRPRNVELLTLVDRRFNRHLPIRSDYTGITIDALKQEYVKVRWDHAQNGNSVVLYTSKDDIPDDE